MTSRLVRTPIDIRARQHNQLITHILYADVRKILVPYLIKRSFLLLVQIMITDYKYILVTEYIAFI
jgi:hypothetical protein